MTVVPFRPVAEFTPPPVSIPANVEAEQAVLGAILIVNPAYLKVAHILRAEHFIEPLHGRIYEACGALIARGQACTPVTIKGLFENDPGLRDVGGATYLANLAYAAISTEDVADYATWIVDSARRRQLIQYATDVMAAAGQSDAHASAADVAQMAEAELFAILQPDAAAQGGLEAVSESGKEAVARVESIWKGERTAGVSTGYRALDALIPGLAPGGYYVLAGRPGMGKTSLALGIGAKVARGFLEAVGGALNDAAGVAFFSLEMTRDQLALILLGQAARVSPHRAERREINQAEMQAIIDAQGRLDGLPLWIDDAPALTPAGIRIRLQRLRNRRRIGLIVVDHMHIMGSDSPRRDGNEVAELTARSAALKAMAKHFAAPVLALAQLNRSVEQREDKRPTLADLRQSGAIEQDADGVLFLYREEYYLDKAQPANEDPKWSEWRTRMDNARGRAEVNIAKQRRGPTGRATLAFDAELQRFRDVE